MGSLSENYSSDFYRSFTADSAQIVVPIICKLLPGIKSVVDYGCGPGLWLREFMRTGIEVQGYDFGDAAPENIAIPYEYFDHLDITSLSPPSHTHTKKYNLAICLEVAEHVPADYAEQLINLLCASSDIVLFSAAVPLQGGTCHINEQWPNYWMELFKKKNFICFDVIRPIIWDNQRIEWWYRNNMLLFLNENITTQFSDLSKMKSFYGYSLVNPDMFSSLLEKVSIKWLFKKRMRKKLVTNRYGEKVLALCGRIKRLLCVG